MACERLEQARQMARGILFAFALVCGPLILVPGALGPLTGAQAQDRAIETGNSITTGEDIEADRATSELIRQRLRAIFRELDGLAGVFVTVNSGVVTLSGTVAEPDLAEEAIAFARRAEGVIAVRDRITISTSLMQRLVPALDRLERRSLTAVAYLPLLAVAALFLGLSTFIGFWVAARQWPWSRLAPNAFIAELIRQLVRIAFFVGGLVLALDILGATALIGTVLGAAGIVGLAIGFAVRDTVENYIASILLSVRQPFAPNDHVEIEGMQGHVIRLTSRATVLMSLDGNHIRIPNATVFKSTITNFTRNPERRFDFTLGINADGDPVRALSTAKRALDGLHFLLERPEPGGWVADVGTSTIDLTLTAWIDQRKTSFGAARSEAIRTVINALIGDGFTLPEPGQRVVISRAAPTRKQAQARKSTATLETGNTREIEKLAEESRDSNAAENLLSEGKGRSEI